MASENPDLIMPVIKSFKKHSSIVKIKTKALDSTLHFTKASWNEVEKVISNPNIKKSCQQEEIPIKGTVMQIKKALMIAYLFEKYPENFTFQLFIILQHLTRKICYFLKK